MNALIESLNRAAAVWWPNVVHGTWQSALVAAVLLGIYHMGRRWPAPLRYSLLMLALLKFAFPPLLSWPTGLFSVTGPNVVLRPPAATAAQGSAFEPGRLRPSSDLARLSYPAHNPSLSVGRDTGGEGGPPLKQSIPTLDWKAWLALAHVAGFLACAAWLIAQMVTLRQRIGGVSSFSNPELASEFAGIVRVLGLRRAPRLVISREINAAIAFGVLRPTVLLPAIAVERLPSAQLRTIMAHELAHVRRGDLWINWLQLGLRAVWWFNPLLWILNRAIRKAREDCCDDLLLARGVTSHDAYCDTLLRAAAELAERAPTCAALGFFESAHPLGHRLARIMDQTLPRAARISLAGLLVVVLGAGLLLPGLRSQESASADQATAKDKSEFAKKESSVQAAVPLASKAAQEEVTKLSDASEKAAILSQEAVKSRASVHADKSIEQLFSVIEMYKANLKRSQAELVAELKRRGAEAVKFLAAELKNQDQPSRSEAIERRKRSVWLLEQFGPAAATATPALVSALEDDDDMVATGAAGALAAIGPAAKQALPALIEALKFKNMNAYNALAKIAPESRQVAEAMVEALREGHPSVPQDQLCYALSDLRGQRDLLEPALIEAASGADTNLLSTIGFALDRIGATSPAAKEILKKRIQNDRLKYFEPIKNLSAAELPQLIARLNEGDQFEQVRATSQLSQLTARLKAEAREAVPALTAYVQDTNHTARGNAVMALGNIGAAAKDAVPVLIAMLDDDEIGTSQNTIHALGEIGPAAKAALPKIRERFKAGDPRTRLSAAVALWRIEPVNFDEVFPFLLKALEAKTQGLEYAAYFVSMVMAEMGPAAKAAVPALKRSPAITKIPHGWSPLVRWSRSIHRRRRPCCPGCSNY